MKTKLKVLLAGAELAPLVKVGGLGDVLGALPKALVKANVDAKVIIPFYGSINKSKYQIKLVKKNISLVIENQEVTFDLYETKLPGSIVKVFLIKNKIFDYKEIYLGGRKYFKGSVYSREISDVERFVFFSKAVVESIRAMNWKLDILHCHDWHTALIPTFVDEYSITDNHFANIKTLFTIHNLANQGIVGLDIVDYSALHHKLTPALMEDYYDQDGQVIDLMKIGILSADYINTVSPNYAQEILTKEYGENLEKYLQRRKKHLRGILNGIDWQVFDPAKDRLIKQKYSLKNFDKAKLVNRAYLQKISKLPVDKNVPIFGLVSRLVNQKGLDILIPALEVVLAKHDLQVIVLGTGQAKYEQALKELQKKYPQKVRANIMFDIGLAQQIYAGADFFLMPSMFEPCGLGQMIAMRYGTIPVVRATGGLKDTVKNNKTGFVFSQYTIGAMIKLLEKTLRFSKNRVKINQMMKVCLKQNFSWDASAKEYVKLYNKLK